MLTAEQQSSVLHLSSVNGVYQKFESKVYVIPGGAISYEQ